jgi:hypothetical protein
VRHNKIFVNKIKKITHLSTIALKCVSRNFLTGYFSNNSYLPENYHPYKTFLLKNNCIQ